MHATRSLICCSHTDTVQPSHGEHCTLVCLSHILLTNNQLDTVPFVVHIKPVIWCDSNLCAEWLGQHQHITNHCIVRPSTTPATLDTKCMQAKPVKYNLTKQLHPIACILFGLDIKVYKAINISASSYIQELCMPVCATSVSLHSAAYGDLLVPQTIHILATGHSVW